MDAPADPLAEPAFEIERFEWTGEGRLEVCGRWFGLRGRRFVRPTLNVRLGDRRRRMVAVLDHKPWAPDGDGTWIAAFAWRGPHDAITAARLEVAPDVVLDLPSPGDTAAGTTVTARARPRRAAPRRLPPPAGAPASPPAEAPPPRPPPAAPDVAVVALERRLADERAQRERASEELAEARRQLEALSAHQASAVARSREVVRLEGELAAAREELEDARAPIEVAPLPRRAPPRAGSQERGVGALAAAAAGVVFLLVVFALILTALF
jgi:hypothetical protein